MPEGRSLTERDIQDAIYRHHRVIEPWPMVLTNVYLHAWEADAIYISRAGYVHEYEIKISRSDFLADRHKPKHSLLFGTRPAGAPAIGPKPDTRPDGPAMFSYVVPEGLVQPEEVPIEAGLWYVSSRPWGRSGQTLPQVRRVKVGKRFKTEPLGQIQWRLMASKACSRFWDERLHRREIANANNRS